MSSDVVIRELRKIEEFQQVHRLFDTIWRPDPGNPPITVELLVGFAHTGNYVAGAFEGDTLVGASVGFLAAGGALHSHVTGAAVTGRGVGYALKSHQRAWCLERGLERITWTFDPLVRRNAHFNLVKLGAMPEEYLEDFYGVMSDAINVGDSSDRLLAVWRIAEERRPIEETEFFPALSEDADGWPDEETAAEDRMLVATPSDVEWLRRHDPEVARAWRRAVRDVLGGAMKAGGRVVGFTGRGEYMVILN
ncbi:GNAT family N-acetyltransferase [Nonomuraea purpurea]|uniref:GNAT family N-acetyltransferase n=1 Tax=Nonomuraea purpurea TaxID=1849276 RepID=A0ABV8G2I3_9ACTN